MKLGEMEVGDGRLIEGIKADVGGQELIDHANARAKFHHERSEFHFGEAEKQRKMERDIPDGKSGGKGTIYADKPADASENAGRQHNHKFLFFSFLSKHFVKDKTYRLSVSDLSTLELGNG